MIRKYYAQRRQGGDNPLGVGIIPVGAIFYLQNEARKAATSASVVVAITVMASVANRSPASEAGSNSNSVPLAA